MHPDRNIFPHVSTQPKAHRIGFKIKAHEAEKDWLAKSSNKRGYCIAATILLSKVPTMAQGLRHGRLSRVSSGSSRAEQFERANPRVLAARGGMRAKGR
jgi:hypothetical protein